MKQKEELVQILNDIILDFQESTGIVDYAVLADDQVILSPAAKKLTEKRVAETIDKLALEKIEERFKKGSPKLLVLEFDDENIYYMRGSLRVQVLVWPPSENLGGLREELMKFIEVLVAVVDTLVEMPDEHLEKIQQAFATIEVIVNEFEVPKFEGFKKLVKYAANLKEE
jgi:hypothetical protein